MIETRPGFVNAHTHIYSGLAPLGMPRPATPPADFSAILRKIWWRLDRALDPDSLEASARYYLAHALLAGTTTLVDHHESPGFIDGSLDVLADVCRDLGMRAVLCYGATERNGGRGEARRGLRECLRFIETNRRPLIVGAVGLHASFTVSNVTIEEAGEMCRELKAPLHVHVAEDMSDVTDAKARGFAGPLERLIRLGAFQPGAILAHGVHLSATQVQAAADAWLVQNPRSNRGNQVGYPAALSESPRVALGTDGYPADMRVEAETLRQEAVRHGEKPAVAEVRLNAGGELAAELFARTSGANGTAARMTKTGEAAAGSSAGADDPAADKIVLEDARVAEVTIAGRLVVSNGRLLTGDLEEIEARAREQAARLWKRMESI